MLVFFGDLILFTIPYYTGWLFLKAISFGRILMEPKREKWNERRARDLSYQLTDIQTAFVGFAFWVVVIAIFLIL